MVAFLIQQNDSAKNKEIGCSDDVQIFLFPDLDGDSFAQLHPPVQSRFLSGAETSQQYFSFGAKINGVWIYYAALMFWNSLPYFTLMDLKKLNSVPSGFHNSNVMDFLFRVMFQFAHCRDRFTFYIVTRERRSMGKVLLQQGRFTNDNTLPVWAEYDMAFECHIPAGSVAEYPLYRDLAGSIPVAHPSWIRRCTLKTDLRMARYPKSLSMIRGE